MVINLKGPNLSPTNLILWELRSLEIILFQRQIKHFTGNVFKPHIARFYDRNNTVLQKNTY